MKGYHYQHHHHLGFLVDEDNKKEVMSFKKSKIKDYLFIPILFSFAKISIY